MLNLLLELNNVMHTNAENVVYGFKMALLFIY